jgi:hypothetical protein
MEESVVGRIINFRGLEYSPINEQGVVFLFGRILEDLNLYIEEIRIKYPDCVASRYDLPPIIVPPPELESH